METFSLHISFFDLDPCFQTGNKTIILGDLNAKSRIWGSRAPNPRGEIIENLLEKYSFTVLNNGQPTYTHHNGTQTHLDITLVSPNLGNKGTFTVINNTLGSDHNPIVLKFLENETLIEETPLLRPNLRKADWVKFKEKCHKLIPDKINMDNVDIFYNTLVSALNEASQISIARRCPFTSASARSKSLYKPRVLPYWNDEIKAAIKARNIARNKMVKRRTDENITSYRELKGKAQYAIKSAARSHWERYCSTLNSNSKNS